MSRRLRALRSACPGTERGSRRSPRTICSAAGQDGRAQVAGRILRGQYVVPPGATEGIDQAAAAELLVDLVLRGQGEYYLGFLSALIAHRLTDLHTSTLYAAIRTARRDLTTVSLAGSELRLVRLSSSRWPSGEDERERVRVQSGLKEFVWRSTIERALVDGLLRPELSGGIETVISSWRRATEHEPVDWGTVWAIAKRLGTATAQRVANLLIHTGHKHGLTDDLPVLDFKGAPHATGPLQRVTAWSAQTRRGTRRRGCSSTSQSSSCTGGSAPRARMIVA
jgi:predicted transcriptional regulator of viral defense system